MPANAPIGTYQTLTARPMTGEPFRPLRFARPRVLSRALLACAALALWQGLVSVLWIWLAA